MRIADYNSQVPFMIREIINSEGLKQRAVAEKANLTPKEFNAMLNGRKIIKPCDIVSIAKALNKTPNDLFKG